MQAIGEELKGLLNPDEYDSAKRTTFNAFYTSSIVIKSMFSGLSRLGVPDDAQALEPGCGPGRFIYIAPEGMRFTGTDYPRSNDHWRVSGTLWRVTPLQSRFKRAAVPLPINGLRLPTWERFIIPGVSFWQRD